MKRPECARQHEVVRSLRSRLWGSPRCDDLRTHAADCAACSEVALVAGWLAAQREQAAAGARLPDAGLVFWKARMRARREAEARAAEPVVYAERIGRACSVVGLVAFALWQRRAIADWLHGASPLVVACAGAALLATALAGYYSIRAEQ